MANRRFEMFEYRQVLTRMRLGDPDRAIARAGLMGRVKLAAVRRLAEAAGWLDPDRPLPEDAELAEQLRPRAPRASSVSSVEAHRERVTKWWRDGVQGTTIHAALVRNTPLHGLVPHTPRCAASWPPSRPPTPR